ncbi:MAG: hypothetical protein ABW221_27930 [Vicinamibacteria bacterium]
MTTPPAGPARVPSRAWIAVFPVAAAAAAAFVSTLRAWFIGDDYGLIRALYDKPALHFFTLFTGTWTDGVFGVRPDELRPFVALSYQLDMWGGATNPLPYHLGSIAYHVLCSCLVFVLARVAVRASLPAALFAGLFFAWHPAHAETVAWISGRADSVPALFYLGALAAYGAWRRDDRPGWYALALASAFCAHFSKQSAITLPFVLLAYELLLESRRGRPLVRSLTPVLPFAALTAAYLGLRQLLFGNYVREQMWSFEMVRAFLRRQPAYVDALLAPAVVPADDLTGRGLALLAVAAAASAVFLWLRFRAPERSRGLDALVLFGPVWYVATIGPLAVTYFSPRHLYLASAGLAVALAALADRLADGRPRPVRAAVGAAGVLLLGADLVALNAHNRYWNDAARASHVMMVEAQRTALAAPAGSLVVLDAPWRTREAFVWGWAVPFTVQPPFASEDLTRRVGVVGHYWAYCCPQDQWLRDLRGQLASWSEAQPAYFVSMGSDPTVRTGSDAGTPQAREALRAMALAPTPEEAERRLQAALGAARLR